MSNNLPHYSWIFPDAASIEKINYDAPHPGIVKFANYAHELKRIQYHPTTVNDLQRWQIAYDRTIKFYYIAIPAIGFYGGVRNGGMIGGLQCSMVGGLIAMIICRLLVTYRSKRILQSRPGESVRQTINRRIKQIYTNGAQ